MTTISPDAARAVRFDRYGERDVLEVREIPMSHPGPDEVLVEVRAAGINLGESIIRRGGLHQMYPATFPSGQGTDFSGRVIEVGSSVTSVEPGDDVLGYSWSRSSHATHVVVPAVQVVPKPADLPWGVAGALDVAGTTAWAAVDGVHPAPGETVVVAGATGGVGSLVVQLLVAQGAEVLGIASARSAAWLETHGATPVEYGDGLEERLRTAAPGGIDAFIDLHGVDYLHLAARLGVAADRTDTVVFSSAARELGTTMAGAAALPHEQVPAVLTELAESLASGRMELPVASTYPLDDVVDAFAALETGHTLGKIVLVP